MIEVALRKALPGFTLDVAWAAGDEVVTLFGPSGAGKSLTLQCLAGLARPDTGRVVVNGRVFAQHAHHPCVRDDQAVDGLQERGLARAGAADQGGELAAGDGQADVGKGRLGAVALPNPRELDRGAGHTAWLAHTPPGAAPLSEPGRRWGVAGAG